ncbi:SDR family oxidoreductase [Aquabacterium sp. J223]|uniref:SDR family oxidoreductase n=1 Tax=Aquabacterium sp. J223 TaxID=2898431 RepID=UPI0021AD7A3B|nr:SDR family oxidoreductase [Aquabacterium sp. J223]UUX95315.1 SDR family oxidoreductase [Aquabacterium sp. J223]
MSLGRLQGKRALVTAAGQGMGRAIALAFAEEGAVVVATDVRADLLASFEGTAVQRTAVLDVCDREAIDALPAALGPQDVIANVAGWVHHGGILDCSEDDWERTWTLNVSSMYRLVKAFLPGMIERGHGSVVNVASVQSSIVANAMRFAYGTSKAAVIGLTKAVALAHAPDGVRCNVICPGVIDTPTVRERVAADPDPRAEQAARLARHPVGRFGRPQEVAALAVHLAGDEAGFTTGGVFVIDGGYTL